MDSTRQRFFAMYEALQRVMGRPAAWTLVQLLRTGNGHPALTGPAITAADVLHLYARLRAQLSSDSAWYLVDLLRTMNDDRLPDGSQWPDGFRSRYASGVGQ